jgi:hypothetical protein
MISATRKTGFLIEDGARLGTYIEVLREKAREQGDSYIRQIADWLNDMPIGTYYEPVQRELIEHIEEVA